MTVATQPSLPVVEHVKKKGDKPKYTASMHKIFEETLRTRTINPNVMLETAHLAPFTDEMFKQEEDAKTAHMAETSATINLQKGRRANQVGRFNAVREQKAKDVATGYATHAEKLETKRAIERKELQVRPVQVDIRLTPRVLKALEVSNP